MEFELKKQEGKDTMLLRLETEIDPKNPNKEEILIKILELIKKLQKKKKSRDILRYFLFLSPLFIILIFLSNHMENIMRIFGLLFYWTMIYYLILNSRNKKIKLPH
jgi:hypothetical protein